ncbi:MAG: tetratricopeptide repeat protein [Tepidisphaeraceae bacterium]|jgi:tetratricopeptide (TPR) repeat protein
MARRRINTKFLAILLLIAVGAGVALYVASGFLIVDHPDRWIKSGQEAMSDGKYTDAARDFARASQLNPKDPSIQMMEGDALGQLALLDPEWIREQQSAYDRALTIDPHYLPAIRKIMDLIQPFLETNPTAELYGQMIDYAQRAQALAPDDKTLAALPDMLIAHKWMNGLSADQPNDALADMRSLMDKDPSNAMLPFTIAQVKVKQATDMERELATSEQSQQVTDLYTDARNLFIKAMDDKGGGQAKNPSMHYRYAQLLRYLSDSDKSVAGNPKTDRDACWDEINKARTLADAKSPDYLAINEYAAELAESRGDHDGAVAIYRDMDKNIPNSLVVRMGLAKSLATKSETRGEAEQILTGLMDKLTDDPTHLAGIRVPIMESLDDMLVTDYSQEQDATKKKQLQDRIQSDLDKINEALGSRVVLDIRRLDARFQFATGDYLGVIQSLTELMADSQKAAEDYACLSLLAGAYEQTHQSGEEINALKRLVDLYPRDVHSRKMLVRELIHQESDEAQPQFDALKQIDPDDPDLPLLAIGAAQAAGGGQPTAQSVQEYQQLPEETADQILIKARMAKWLQNWDEAARLYSVRVQKVPNDVASYEDLAKVLSIEGQKDQALAVATKAESLDPNNTDLQVLVAALKGDDADAIAKLKANLIQTHDTDPVQKELDLAQVASQLQENDQEEAHLLSAEKLASTNEQGKVWERLFNFYILTRRLDDAAKYATKLTAINFDQAGGRMYQLKLAEAHNDFQGAMTIVTSLTTDRGQFADSWVAYGDLLRAAGQYDQAIEQYEVALSRQANNAQAYEGLIRCEYAVNSPIDALRYINEALQKQVNDPALRDMLIDHQLKYGNPQDAVATIQDELRQEPNSPNLHSAMIDVYLRVAKKMSDNQQDQDAMQVLQAAQQHASECIARWPDEAKFYYQMAQIGDQAKQPDLSEKALLALAARDAWKLRPEPYSQLALHYENNNQPDQAEAALKKAMDVSGNRADIQIQLAALLTEHKKFDDALSVLASANADRPEILEMRFQVLAAAGKSDQAQAELSSALAKNPPDASKLHSIWARILMEAKNYPEAINQATQALQLAPYNTDALFVRGCSKLHQQPSDAEGASIDLLQFLQLKPDDLSGREALADAFVAMDRTEDATTQLESALQTDPTDKTVRMSLVKLYSNGANPHYSQALRLLREVDSQPPYNTDAEIFRIEAVLFRDLGDLNNAVNFSEKALSLHADDPLVVRTDLEMLLAAKQYQIVISRTSALPDELKKTSWANTKRAVAEAADGDQTDAQADFATALSAAVAEKDDSAIYDISQTTSTSLGVDPALTVMAPFVADQLTCRLATVLLLHQKGDDVQAAGVIQPAMDILAQLSKPQQISVVGTAAQIYQTAKPQPMVDKAYDAYQKWLTLDPNNKAAMNNLAWMLVENYSPPRIQEAMDLITKAVGPNPIDGQMDLNLEDTHGWLLILSGDTAKGVDELNTVVDTRPSPETYLHLGEGYLLLQRPEEAQDQAKLGLAIVSKQDPKVQDSTLLAKLQDLSARADKMAKSKQSAQAQ